MPLIMSFERYLHMFFFYLSKGDTVNKELVACNTNFYVNDFGRKGRETRAVYLKIYR